MKTKITNARGLLCLSALLAASVAACSAEPMEDSGSSSDELKEKCKEKKKKKDDDDKKKDDDACKGVDLGDPVTAPAVPAPPADPKYAGNGKKYSWCSAASYTSTRKLPFEAGLTPAKTADLRPFRWATFNKLTLAMGPVGKSDTTAVKALAKELMRAGAPAQGLRDCTYFFNMTEDKSVTAAFDVPDKKAEDNVTFNWAYVSNPSKQPDAKLLAAEYTNLASVLFSSAPKVTFTSPIPAGQKDPFIDGREIIPMQRCAEEAGLLLMGCDSNHHRGPSVEGRLLAFAGCSPEDAYATVDTLWGANGVPPAARMRIVEQGVEDRARFPAASKRLMELLLSEAEKAKMPAK